MSELSEFERNAIAAIAGGDPDESEEWKGGRFRVYSRSKFLEFVAAGTFADGLYPGAFEHYEILCENHVVDVASVSAPVARPRAPSSPFPGTASRRKLTNLLMLKGLQE